MISYKKCRRKNGGTLDLKSEEGKLLAFLVLALLVGNAAAGLAGGLAGSLALAAATVLRALAKILGLQGLNVVHQWHLRSGGNSSMGLFYQMAKGKSTFFIGMMPFPLKTNAHPAEADYLILIYNGYRRFLISQSY